MLPIRTPSAAYGLKGDTDRAAAEVAEGKEGFRRRNDNRWGMIALVRKNSAEWNTPVLHDRFEEFFYRAAQGRNAGGMRPPISGIKRLSYSGLNDRRRYGIRLST